MKFKEWVQLGKWVDLQLLSLKILIVLPKLAIYSVENMPCNKKKVWKMKAVHCSEGKKTSRQSYFRKDESLAHLNHQVSTGLIIISDE